MCSSVVERYVDIVEVISSILITPTKLIFGKSFVSNLGNSKVLYFLFTESTLVVKPKEQLKLFNTLIVFEL